MVLMFRIHQDTSSVRPYDDVSFALTGGLVDEVFSWIAADRLGRDLQMR